MLLQWAFWPVFFVPMARGAFGKQVRLKQPNERQKILRANA